MEATRAVDAVFILIHALPEDERTEVFERFVELRMHRMAADSVPARCLRSLRAVAERLGHTPSSTEYRRVGDELRAAGEDIEPFNRIYKHYDSWPRAREALALSEDHGVSAIEARFRHRVAYRRRYSGWEESLLHFAASRRTRSSVAWAAAPNSRLMTPTSTSRTSFPSPSSATPRASSP